MFVKCLFYNPRTDSFGGNEYSYRCAFPVKPGDIVRVQAKDGTSVCRVARIVEESNVGIPLSMLRDVICVEPENPSVSPVAQIAPETQAVESSPELIVIRQLPVIEERLHDLKEQITVQVGTAMSLAVTEDTLKDVKKVRANLNAQFKALEDQRKAVKKQIMAPYDRFEEVYAECVTSIFAPADRQLKDKIDSVEGGLKDVKRERLKAYFAEYRASIGVDPQICDFDRMGINVRLSDTDKALKTQAKCAVDTIAGDIKTIGGMEFSEEIMAEYRVTLNLNGSVAVVRDRHARIEEEKRRRAEAEAREAERQAQLAEAAAKVEEVIDDEPFMEMPPEPVYDAIFCDRASEPTFEAPEEEPEEELPFIEFRVYGTIEQLKALKKFMIDGGYQYDQI